MFGSTFNSTPAASTGNSNLFGNAAKPTTGSLFGSTTSAFGTQQTQQPQQQSGGLFGSNFNSTPAASTGSSSLFGNSAKPTTGSLFGTNNTSAFGTQQTQQPQQQSGGLFGSTFGSTPAASTGNNSLFGNAAKPTTGGLFGNTTSTFGTQQTQQPQQQSGGLFSSFNAPATSTSNNLFGSPAKPAGSLFGNTNQPFGTQQNQQPQQNMMSAPTQAPVQPIYLGKSDESAVQRLIIESQLASSPYGDSPIFKPKNNVQMSSSILSKGEESK